MVIRAAERIQLGEITFEDEQMDDEQIEEAQPLKVDWQMVSAYQEAKYVLCDDDSTWAEQEEAVQTLEQLWDAGLTVAAHQLGKCWRDGLGVLPDDDKTELWFLHSAEAGNDFSQYALGKLLQQQGRITEAVEWYEQASAQSNQCADYRLGKLYLQGKDVPKDTAKAIEHLIQAAESGNQYAQFFLNRWDNLKPPSIMLSVTQLLHHMSKIFQDNSVPPQAPAGQQMDRKLQLKIREKKIAMGYKPDDHEEQTPSWTMTMG